MATIKDVKAAMEKLGYRPNANARALVSKSSNAIGVLVSDVSAPFFGIMVKACESLVLHSKGMSDQELTKLAKEVPGMVLINRVVPDIASRCIALDNRKGAYIATEYLIKNGHKHIGYIASSHNIDDAHDRLAGYFDALRDYGIEARDEYVEYGFGAASRKWHSYS